MTVMTAFSLKKYSVTGKQSSLVIFFIVFYNFVGKYFGMKLCEQNSTTKLAVL